MTTGSRSVAEPSSEPLQLLQPPQPRVEGDDPPQDDDRFSPSNSRIRHIQQDVDGKHRRFSRLRFRHASAPQLSLRARQQANQEDPPLPLPIGKACCGVAMGAAVLDIVRIPEAMPSICCSSWCMHLQSSAFFMTCPVTQ